MFPRRVSESMRAATIPSTGRHSAVLALLCEEAGQLFVLLTVRTHLVASHKGQLSLPGGRIEEGESIEEAALRETREEVGVYSDEVAILGRLSDMYTAPSNSIIHPVLGWWNKRQHIEYSSEEVEEIIYVPLDTLSEENVVEENWELRGNTMTVPYWNVHHTVPLWGATAIMLSELAALHKEWTSRLSER
jgi:8-oxo-dGTP pyrophosphatase MutT (NUDIX family)